MTIKTITITANGIASNYHLERIEGVATWCYHSGAIITNPTTIAYLQAHA